MSTPSETPSNLRELTTLQPDRETLLRRIANLWRGDWTGFNFDGRDGKRWILTALTGDAARAELDRELTEQENDDA